MNTVAVIQTRLGSSRLPAKVLLDLGGCTALERCLSRVARVGGVTEVVVATTNATQDDVIVHVARRLGYRLFRGSEHDVLSRYLGAAREAKADVIVRCTSDCPLLDPAVSTLVVQGFIATQTTLSPLDYASNTLSRQLPRGLDTEVASVGALERAAREATSEEREHVTMHLYHHPERFRCGEFLPLLAMPLAHHRWTLDTLDDYCFLSLLCAELGPRAATASMDEILSVLSARPDLVAINAQVRQKTS